MKNSIKPSIGIWGLGRVGSAAIRFFSTRCARMVIYDSRPLTDSEKAFLAPYHVTIASSPDELMAQCDAILPSPGVDIAPYHAKNPALFLSELDLFFDAWQKPIIAVTGSVGKTTTTTLITTLLQHAGMRVWAAGNIGLPVFDVLAQRDELDMVVLEVSSFQLEYTARFAPDIAVWTNFFPNHLDRHKTIDSYLNAKLHLLMHQRTGQRAIVPVELMEELKKHAFLETLVPFGEKLRERGYEGYSLEHDTITRVNHDGVHPLIPINDIPDCTFPLNWLVAYSVLDTLSLPITAPISGISLAHRLEKVTTIEGVSFYNDSKSTVPAATIAALQSLPASRILLFLGGLSKGIDRAPFIQSLAPKPTHIFCFGKEAPALYAMCTRAAISASSHETLDDAFQHCTMIMKNGDCVLFSPAGSSYDLFKNYEDRGDAFKRHVHAYQKRTTAAVV